MTEGERIAEKFTCAPYAELATAIDAAIAAAHLAFAAELELVIAQDKSESGRPSIWNRALIHCIAIIRQTAGEK